MRVFVAGGTGVVGRRLVPQLVARGHQVTATTTSPTKLGLLGQLGADAIVMDGLDAVSIGEAVAKARPDAIPNDAGDFADLKTTTSVQTADLARTIAEYGYHQQAALIASGWHAITGKDVASFSFVFVESKPPFCTRIVTLKDADLARGERQNFVAVKTFAKCMETGEWPGPGGADAEYLELPTWAQTRIDNQLELAEAQ